MKKLLERILSFALVLVMTAGLLLTGVPAPVAYATADPDHTLKVTLSCETEGTAYKVTVSGCAEEAKEGISVVPEPVKTDPPEPDEGFEASDSGDGEFSITGTGTLTKVTVTVDGITFTFGEGAAAIPTQSASTELTVDITADSSVTVSTREEASKTLSAKLADNVSGGTITWSGGDPDVTVSDEGVVTAANAKENVEITATLTGESGTTYATAKVQVTAKAPVVKITGYPSGIQKSYNKEEVGEGVKLTYKFTGFDLTENDCKVSVTKDGTDFAPDPGSPSFEDSDSDGYKDEATLTYTVKEDGRTYTYPSGEGATTSFTVDTIPPTGTLTVTEDESGLVATLTEVSEDVSVKFAASSDKAFSDWGSGSAYTAHPSPDGTYTVNSISKTPGGYIHVQMTDTAGNKTTLKAGPIVTAAIGDIADLTGIPNVGNSYYFNEGNREKLHIPVTGLDALKDIKDIKVTINECTVQDLKTDNPYITLKEDGEINLKDAATLTYITYTTNGISITLKAGVTGSNTYILDTVGPTVEITVSPDWTVYQDESGRLLGIAPLDTTKLNQGEVPETIPVTVTVTDQYLDLSKLPGGADVWEKVADADYAYSCKANLPVTAGTGGNQISLENYRKIQDAANNNPSSVKVGETALTVNTIAVITEWGNQPASATISWNETCKPHDGTDIYTGDQDGKLTFDINVSDWDDKTCKGITFSYTLDGENWQDASVDLTGLKGQTAGTVNAIVNIQGKEGTSLQVKAAISQEMTIVDGYTEIVSWPFELKGTYKYDDSAPLVAVTWIGRKANEEEPQGVEDPSGGAFYELVATITVTDLHFDKDSTVITIPGGVCGAWEQVEGEDNTWTCKVTFNTDGEQSLSITAKDAAGHETPIESGSFIIDRTIPDVKIEWAYRGSDDPVPLDENGFPKPIFHPYALTATITVKEANPSQQFITLTTTGAKVEEDWKVSYDGSSFTFSRTYLFTDGNSQNFSVEAVDLAGNKIRKDSSTFNVDTTAPVVTVSFDNNEVHNGKYFNGSRTATVTVTEANFEDSTITFPKAWENNPGVVVGEWEEGAGPYDHVCTITFGLDAEGNNVDGTYTFDITVVDPADLRNKGYKAQEGTICCEEFVIDTQNPHVEVALEGNISSIFKSPVYGKDNNDQGNEADYAGVYFVQVNPVTTEDGQTKEETVTLSITVTDQNLPQAGSSPEAGTEVTLIVTGPDGKEVTLHPAIETDENGSMTYGYTYNVEVSGTEAKRFRYGLHVSDLAANKPTEKKEIGTSTAGDDSTFEPNVNEGVISNDFSVDRRQPSDSKDDLIPQLTIKCNTSPVDGTENLFKENPSYTVTVTDGELNGVNAGLKSVTWTVNDNRDNSNAKVEGKESLTGELSGNAKERSETLTLTPTDESGEAENVKLTIRAEDYVGNVITKYVTLNIDKTAPRLTLSYDDSDQNHAPNAGRYFRGDRSVIVTVEDLFLTEGTLTVVYGNDTETGREDHNLAELKAESEDGKLKFVFKAEDLPGAPHDLDYTLYFLLGDAAGHVTRAGYEPSGEGPGQLVSEGNVSLNATTEDLAYAFTVDKVAPVIQVGYDNNDVRNGRYYNAGRTATVHITERNWNANDVNSVVHASLAGEGVAAPGLGGWGGQGVNHVSSVVFAADADYSLQITYTDLAGNPAQAYDSGLFTVDTTDPEVEITNIEDHSANRGEVVPVISYSDINFDDNGYRYRITKIVNLTEDTEVQIPNTVASAENGVVVTFQNLAATLENDGIYTIYATVTDLAGNSSETSVMYSVNRKGSTYYAYDDPTKELLRNVYANTAPTLRIAEVNPDLLTEYSVTVSANNSNTVLVEGTDYTVEQTGGENSFKQYIYTINSSAFLKDGALAEGAYTLVLDSTDTAGNLNSNRANENSLAVNFTLDATAPILTYTGFENDERIQAESRAVTVYFEDGYALSRVEILLDGAVIKTLEGEELAEAGGSYTFEIQQARDWQTLSAKAYDAAGNHAELPDARVYVNSSWVIIHSTELIVGAGAGVILLAVILILLLRRRNKNEDAPTTAASK